MIGVGEKRTNTGPDFLVVGAQRSGTSLLHKLLRSTPGIWVPPVKEVHYFDRKYAGLDWHKPKLGMHKRIRDVRTLRRRGVSFSDRMWGVRYLCLPPSDGWYRSLFKSAGNVGYFTGEITPGYGILPQEGVERIQRVCPNVKILFLLRNPVERTWSHIKKKRLGKASPSDLPEKVLQEMIDLPDVRQCSDYRSQVSIYDTVFGSHNVSIFFFEDLLSSPDATFKDILTTIGDFERPADDVMRRMRGVGPVNVTPHAECPEHIRTRLLRRYQTDMRWLKLRAGRLPERWVS